MDNVGGSKINNKGYIKISREYVLKSLKELGGWHTALEVCKYGTKYYYDNVPRTIIYGSPVGHSSGGWCVWDYTDRVKRALEYMCVKGLVIRRETDKQPEYLYVDSK